MYELSKNYKELYELICSGNRVAAFVDYSFGTEFNPRVMRDICLIEKNKGRISCFVRGISYFEVCEWQTPNLTEEECFIVDCKQSNIEFIPKSS